MDQFSHHGTPSREPRVDAVPRQSLNTPVVQHAALRSEDAIGQDWTHTGPPRPGMQGGGGPSREGHGE
ncbi:unnamed protein product [Lota lota]